MNLKKICKKNSTEEFSWMSDRALAEGFYALRNV
jgi:hypothetical protein